jgi:hypothetical protein
VSGGTSSKKGKRKTRKRREGRGEEKEGKRFQAKAGDQGDLERRSRRRGNTYVQLIPADMRLRISIPDYDFRITNFDSVNLCTSKVHFHTDFRFPHFLISSRQPDMHKLPST